MFPICNDVGEVIAFSGRFLKERGRRGEISELTGDTAFPKRQRPFRVAQIQARIDRGELRDRVRRPARFDHLVRGRDHECRRAAGDGVHRKSGAHLKRFVNEVVLCFDADAAGAKAAERSLDALLQNDLIVRVVEMPPGEDPDSLVRREGKEAFEKRIAGARDFFDYLDRARSDCERRSHFVGGKDAARTHLAETRFSCA